MSDSKKIFPFIIVAFLIIIVVGVLFSLNGETISKQTDKKDLKVDAEKEINKTKDYDTDITGIIRNIDKEAKTISLYEAMTKTEKIFTYHNGTSFLDKHDEELMNDEIVVGEMVDIYYASEDNKAAIVQKSKKVWEYTRVSKYTVDKLNKKIVIGSKNYEYTDDIVIANEDKLISFIDLTNRDKLTVQGIGDKIYSMIVTTGHGYVRFINYEKFIGGLVEVGYNIIVPVTEDMLITAPEGRYEINIQNGNLIGKKNIIVSRDEETIVDVGEVETEIQKTGEVIFKVTPFGAELKLDGKIVDYSEPIRLTFGEHITEVTLGGYEKYIGLVSVRNDSQTVNINLAEPENNDGVTDTDAEDTEEDDDMTYDDAKEENSENNSSGTSDSNNSDDAKDDEYSDTSTNTEDNNTADNNADVTTSPNTGEQIDQKHKIYINNPSGADVYLDGEKIGISPLSIPKKIGAHTISFRQDGYETKSYNIEAVNDNQDLKLYLPDMSKTS